MRNLFILFNLLVLYQTSKAQEVLQLNDIAKITFVVQPGGLTDDYKSLEVVPENNKWNCYQTRLKRSALKGFINDSSRKFLREVPVPLLTRLVSAINYPDTVADIKLFKIDNDRLMRTLDSLSAFSPAQKASVTNRLKSPGMLDKALYDIYHPIFKMMYDRSYLGIIITTKDSKSFEIHTSTFGYSYFEPWNVKRAITFNPDLSIIYETVMNEEARFDSQKMIYKQLAREIYYQLFGRRAN